MTPLVEAGADFLAVSGAVWNGDEVAAIEAFANTANAKSHNRPSHLTMLSLV